MKIDTGKNQFNLFRYLGEEECYVVVPSNYKSFIDAAEKEYGELSNVPSDWTVRGIFIKNMGQVFDENSQQNDVIVKNLSRFDAK